MFQYREGSNLFRFEFMLKTDDRALDAYGLLPGKFATIPTQQAVDDRWRAGWRRLAAAYEWCTEQFGSEFNGNGIWYCEQGIATIYFKSETDACAFRLRWC